MSTVAGIERRRPTFPEEGYGGDQHQPREETTADHDRGRPVADDVADAQELGRDVARDLGRAVSRQVQLGDTRPELGHRGHELEDEAGGETAEHVLRLSALLLARDEHLGAGGAFGVGEHAVLLHDQVATQRDHHQDPEHASAQREHEGPKPAHLEAQQDQGGQGEGHPGRDRLPRRARGLHHRVLEDRGSPAEGLGQRAEDRDGDDRDGHGCRDGESDPQGEVDRGRTEHDPQQRAHEQGPKGQLGRGLVVGHVGLEGGGRGRLGQTGTSALAFARERRHSSANDRPPTVGVGPRSRTAVVAPAFGLVL